jgi:hypothetical protein
MRKRNFGLLILAIAVALAVMGLATGCGSATSGTTDTGVKTYTDSTYGFSFDYPSDWQVDSSGSADVTSGADPVATITAGDPDGKLVSGTGLDLMMVRVYQLAQVVDEAALPEVLPILEGLVADFQSQDPTFVIDTPLAETTVNGVPGYQVSGTFDWDADTPVKTTFYFLFDGDMEYQLMVQAFSENWQADQAVFDAFVASFKPASGNN